MKRRAEEKKKREEERKRKEFGFFNYFISPGENNDGK